MRKIDFQLSSSMKNKLHVAVSLAAGSHLDRYWLASFEQLDSCSLQAVSEQECPHSGGKKAVGPLRRRGRISL